MLPVRHRLTRRADFAQTTRHGVRLARAHCVLHLRRRDDVAPTRVGFVVSRKVGGSVTRHLVTRRLRAILAPELVTLPPGFDLVVRALPPAGTAGFEVLRAELHAALPDALAKAARR